MVRDRKSNVVVAHVRLTTFRFVQQGAVAQGCRSETIDVFGNGDAGVAGVGNIVHGQHVLTGDVFSRQRAGYADPSRRRGSAPVAAGPDKFDAMHFRAEGAQQVGREYRGPFQQADQDQPGSSVILVYLTGQPGNSRA